MSKNIFRPAVSCLIVVLLHLFSATSLFALLPQRGWTVGLAADIHWGQAREILYANSDSLYSNKNDYMSLLLWELHNIPSIGLSTHWESGRNFRFDVEFNTVIPGIPSGQMNDYDWFYTDRDWSHWSVSDIDLRWGFNADISVDWNVKGNSEISFHLGASYALSSWAWTDDFIALTYSKTIKDKTYPIPFGTYPEDKYRFYADRKLSHKNTVDYEVTYQSILAKAVVRLHRRVLFIDWSLRIGPVLVLSLDQHKLRNLQFREVGFGFPWLDTNLEVGFRIKEWTLGVRAQFTWVNDLRGNVSVYGDSGEFLSFSANIGGFGFYSVGVGIYIAWSLKPRPGA